MCDRVVFAKVCFRKAPQRYNQGNPNLAGQQEGNKDKAQCCPLVRYYPASARFASLLSDLRAGQDAGWVRLNLLLNTVCVG